jgi:hypothetical protein
VYYGVTEHENGKNDERFGNACFPGKAAAKKICDHNADQNDER